MKLGILGGSGRTGRLIVERALDDGHQVTVLVRDPSRPGLQHDRLTVMLGDANDAARVEQFVIGQDAILSAMGPVSGSPKDLMAKAARNVVTAMAAHRIRRLVWLTGAGVRDDQDRASAVRGFMVGLMKLVSPAVFRDSTTAFQTVRISGLDWTVVRVPRLGDAPPTGNCVAGFTPPGLKSASRADVAEFMLNQLSDGAYVCQAPMVSC